MGTQRCGRLAPELRAQIAAILASSAASPDLRAQAAEAEAEEARRLRRRIREGIWRVTCSSAWHWHLYSLIVGGKLQVRGDPSHPEHALMDAALYPPGGWRTLMRRCDYCRRWVPPQAVLRPRLCPRCVEAWKLEDRVRGQGSRPLAPGRCTACRGRWVEGRQADGRPILLPARDHPLIAVQICLECDANRMTPVQIARTPGAHASDRKVRDSELPAHFEAAGYRRSRRVRYRHDDRQAVGGPVDELGVIRSWPEIWERGGSAEGQTPSAPCPAGQPG